MLVTTTRLLATHRTALREPGLRCVTRFNESPHAVCAHLMPVWTPHAVVRDQSAHVPAQRTKADGAFLRHHIRVPGEAGHVPL